MAASDDAVSIGATAAFQKRGRVKRTYYPVVLLKLTVRLDDFTNEDGETAVDDSVPAVSPVVQALRDSNVAHTNARVLASLGESDLETETSDRAADLKLATDVGALQAPPGNVHPDDLSFTVLVVPLDAKIELNGFTIADKLQASFAMGDLPIIPDILRSLFVEAYVGTASAEDFGTPAKWIPKLLDPKLGQTPTFRGYADVVDMEASDDFKICIQARSMEAVLMDKKVHPMVKERRIKRTDHYVDESGKLVRGEKLVNFIKRFLSTIPEFASPQIGVRLFPNFDIGKEPILSAAMFNRSLQTAQSRAQAGGQVQGAPVAPPGTDGAQQDGGGTPVMPAQTPGEISAWEVVVRACALCGLIPVYDPSLLFRNAPADGAAGPTDVVRGADTILLMPPQTVYETPRDGLFIAGGPTDGFTREVSMQGSGAPLHTEVRFLVWGHNLKRMKMSRKFGRAKAPAVRVVCYNPDAGPEGRVLVAQFPTTKIGSGHVSAAGTGQGKRREKGKPPQMEVITKEVHGVRDLALLKQIAVGFYHSLSRHEVSVEIETDELSSYIDPTMPDSHNENPDLLKLRPGTPCRVMVASRVVDPVEGAMSVDALANLFDRRANPAFLRNALLNSSTTRGVPGEVDKAIIDDALAKIESSFQKAKLTDWFFCRVLNINWSVEDGIEMSMELANFIEARNLTNLSAQDKKDNDRRKKVKTAHPDLPDPRKAAAAKNRDAYLDSIRKDGR